MPNKLTEGSNVLWESSRMILPEHKERINQRRREVMGRGEPKKPRLSEYEMEELAYQLQEAMENGTPLALYVWSRGAVVGKIVKMVPETKMVHVRTPPGDVVRVPFFDIVKAEKHKEF